MCSYLECFSEPEHSDCTICFFEGPFSFNTSNLLAKWSFIFFFCGDHFPVAVTKEVETASLEALDAVHACGLLHGDISPQNIMVVGGK